MKNIQYTIDIIASKEAVWETLWGDETFRDWSGLIDEGTYMKGELKVGNEIEFISEVNGYGVTSLVEEVIPYAFLLLRHAADTMNSGQQTREKQWSGGTESYTLVELEGVTTLTVAVDVPTELEEIMNASFPKALARIKAIAEMYQ